MSADSVPADLHCTDTCCCAGHLLLYIHERFLLGLCPVIHVFCKEWVARYLRRTSSDDWRRFFSNKNID